MEREERNFREFILGSSAEQESMGKLVDVLREHFQNMVLENLGTRSLPLEKIRELSNYWTASVLPWVGTLRDRTKAKGITLQELSNSSKEEIVLLVLHGPDNRKQGVEEYSAALGEDLGSLVEQKSREQDRPVKLLDVGCADGFFLADCQKKFGASVEPSGVAPSYEGAEKREGIEFRVALAEILPEDFDEKFDVIVSVDASMYFLDPARAFDEILRSLKNQGILLLGHGTIKPGVNESLAAKIFGVKSNDEIYKLMRDRHRAWYEHVTDLVKQQNFTQFNRKFVVEKHEVTNESWTPEVLKVRRVE